MKLINIDGEGCWMQLPMDERTAWRLYEEAMRMLKEKTENSNRKL